MTLLLERAASPQLANELLIYGAGSNGKSVCAQLEKIGVKVAGFIDQNKNGRSSYCGLPLFGLDELSVHRCDKQILIAVHNYTVNIVEVVAILKSYGFDNLLTMVDYANVNPSDKSFRFFLASADDILAQENEIRCFYGLLSDIKSKQLYEQLVKFRLGHGYDFCPIPEGGAYVPSDLPRWKNSMRLVDCGAYDGDSINVFQKANYELEAVCAFEPDLKNYNKLIESCSELSAICVPCGVGSATRVLRFNSSDVATSSRVTETGDSVIQICSIDGCLRNWSPTLIKMDIEGAEYDAIQGAKHTIAACRPGLAISAYHLYDDLWRLGLAINEIVDDYDFYLRCHAYSSFETVLYAIPR